MSRDFQSKTRGEKNARKSGQLTIDLIKDLGGTKNDLRLLQELDEQDDVEDLVLASDDFDIEPIKKDEIRDFIQELGIFEHRPDTGKEKIKPKKLAKAPMSMDDEEDTTPGSLPAERPITKKEKNKFKAENTVNKMTEKLSEAVRDSSQFKMKKKHKVIESVRVQHDEISSTTTNGLEELMKHLKTLPQRTHLLIKPGDTWMDDQVGIEKDVTSSLIHQCQTFAARLLAEEVELYKKQREKAKRGESKWIQTVLTSGTLSDKMAALLLLLQESAIHNLGALDMLVAMTKKKGKREAMLASDTLKNLFLSEASPLPDDRKLVAFDARPLSTLWLTYSGNKDSVDRRLLAWYAEDLLRQKYSAFIKFVDVMSYDSLLATKEKALAVVHGLLVSKPEQENVLLPMLVNKLGDPNHKIASKASYLLLKLVEQHPNMKCVIVKEVERLIYRPNVADRAQYYAMCFLNQIKLHKADHALASQLIGIFFAFFKVYVNKGEVDSKMMAALLTGVNRAYPYAKLKRDFLNEQMAALYKIVHVVNFNTSVQALMLLYQVTDPSTADSDRFFMALYRKLLDPALRSSAKQPQFLNLLYKCMKADLIEKRVKAILKRLLQAGTSLAPNFLCGALMVISQVLRERPSLLAVRQLGKLSTQRYIAAVDTPTCENSPGRLDHNILFDDDDDEEEKFVDLPLPAEFQEEDSRGQVSRRTERDQSLSEENEEKKEKDSQQAGLSKSASSWIHRQNLKGKFEQQGYDPGQRNPLHCHAERQSLWELRTLTHHYHPSVSLFAQTVLKGEFIDYSGDPLQDFTLIRFLDRFVYKNPKKKDIEQARHETVGNVSAKRRTVPADIPVNSSQFIEGGEEAVPEHERYLYRYFSQKAEQRRVQQEKEEGSDVESVSDTEFDDFLDKYERQVDYDDLGNMDFGLSLTGKEGRKKKGKEEADESTDDNSQGGLSDEEIDFGDEDDNELAAEFRREMEGLENDDGEDEDVSGDELKEMMAGSRKRSKKKAADFSQVQEKKSKKNRGDGLKNVFASADAFSDLLDENADNASAGAGTLDDVCTTDKASSKQIAWESKRERQTQGRDWRQSKGYRKPHGKGGKPARKGHKSGGAAHWTQGGKKKKYK